MDNTIVEGRVSFVNHEKEYVVIDYEVNNKSKTIIGKVDEAAQQPLINKKLTKQLHQFQIGDVVNFIIQLSPRGDKMVANEILYKYNTALDALIDKSKTKNVFLGYIKEAEGKFFIKEIDSYLFLPLKIAAWQLKPAAAQINEQAVFALTNTNNREKTAAQLTAVKYIPEYYSAEKAFKTKAIINAVIYKISPNGIYINVIKDKIQAKLPFKEGYQLNNTVAVKITYLSPDKIVVEEA